MEEGCKMTTFSCGERINNLIEEGFIDEKGKPLKCQNCEGEDLEEYGHCYEDNHFLVEYQVSCKKCYHNTGLWAYGHWEV